MKLIGVIFLILAVGCYGLMRWVEKKIKQSEEQQMSEYKMCANAEMAIEILEFIKRNYEKHSDQAGVQKYIEALQMGIEALKERNED